MTAVPFGSKSAWKAKSKQNVLCRWSFHRPRHMRSSEMNLCLVTFFASLVFKNQRVCMIWFVLACYIHPNRCLCVERSAFTQSGIGLRWPFLYLDFIWIHIFPLKCMHNFSHRALKSIRHSSIQGTSVIVGMLSWGWQSPHWFDDTQWKVQNMQWWSPSHSHYYSIHVRHIKGTRTLADMKKRLQVAENTCRLSMWVRQSWQKLKEYIHILLTFFLPFVYMEIYKKEIWSWTKALFHWIPHRSPTGKITVLKKKRYPDSPARSSSLASHTPMETRTHVHMYSKEVLI